MSDKRDYTFIGYWSKPKQTTNCQLFVTSFFCRHTDTLYPQYQQWNLVPSDIHHIKILSHLQNCFKNSLRTTNKYFKFCLLTYLPYLPSPTPHYTSVHPCQRLCMRAYVCVHACIRVCWGMVTTCSLHTRVC